MLSSHRASQLVLRTPSYLSPLRSGAVEAPRRPDQDTRYVVVSPWNGASWLHGAPHGPSVCRRPARMQLAAGKIDGRRRDQEQHSCRDYHSSATA